MPAVRKAVLQILADALAARGLDYTVAGKNQNVDVELPMLVGTSPLAFDDVRLTAVLAAHWDEIRDEAEPAVKAVKKTAKKAAKKVAKAAKKIA
mgnify:CR=1 FL=1